MYTCDCKICKTVKLRPVEDVTDEEWARYARAKRGGKVTLTAYLTAWPRRSAPPKPFKPDLRQVIPTIESGAVFRVRSGDKIAKEPTFGPYVGEQ